MKLDQPPGPPREAVPMTQTEKDMLLSLSKCTFLPGSWEKRFVRNLHQRSQSKDPTLTHKQREWLVEIAYRYRNQIERQLSPSPDALSRGRGQGGGVGES